MKQLRRLKDLLSGEDDSESTKKAKEPQSDSELKTEKKKSEVQKATSEKPAEPAPEKEVSSKETEKVNSEAAPEEGASKEDPVNADSKEGIPSETKAENPDEEFKNTEKPVENTEEKTESEAIKKPQTKRSDNMTLFEGRAVDTLTRSDIDENFKQEIIDAGAESLAVCFQCGTCTGSCPSGRRTPYRVRQLVRRSLAGFKEDLLKDDTIWMCTTCYECQERCPRGIKIVDIVKIVRNYASRAGHMGQAHKMTGAFVIKTGHGVPINDATKSLRKSVGLDELPPTTHEFPEALEEVQTILKTTKFDSLIGYNWETGELE